MINQHCDLERFDTKHPNLCTALRWKGQFIEAEPDPTVQAEGDPWGLLQEQGPGGVRGRRSRRHPPP